MSMAQIDAAILSRLSAPHLRPLKKQDLLDLYKRLHDEYAQFTASDIEQGDEEEIAKSQLAVLNSIPTLRATVNAAASILAEAQKARDEALARPKVTRKEVMRDEAGRIASVEETTA